MYALDIRLFLKKKLIKLAKKNPKQAEIIAKKSEELIINPHRYKNLRVPLNYWKRVHIDKHFVLVFSVDEKTKTIILEDYDHHDNVYDNRPK
jgi:YafQ family addiction module toxin component|tara:strand:+ start:2745 stop:3020 length:276 start_codon:yes stop_codon:yes gene_type:complete